MIVADVIRIIRTFCLRRKAARVFAIELFNLVATQRNLELLNCKNSLNTSTLAIFIYQQCLERASFSGQDDA